MEHPSGEEGGEGCTVNEDLRRALTAIRKAAYELRNDPQPCVCKMEPCVMKVVEAVISDRPITDPDIKAVLAVVVFSFALDGVEAAQRKNTLKLMGLEPVGILMRREGGGSSTVH